MSKLRSNWGQDVLTRHSLAERAASHHTDVLPADARGQPAAAAPSDSESIVSTLPSERGPPSFPSL